MKITAGFEDGVMHLNLLPETTAERRMVGAVLDQPQQADGHVHLDNISAELTYEGHFTNKLISRVKVRISR